VSTDGRSTRWDDHRVARRRELVEATLRAIRAHGAGVGLDDVAATAGTSKTVLYRHFGDRGGLYAAVCASVDARILRDVGAALGAPGADLAGAGSTPREVIGAAIDAYLRLVERDPEVYRFVVTAPLLGTSAQGDPAAPVTGHVAAQLAAVVGDALRSSGRATAPAEVWATGLVGMVRAAADRWLASPDGLTRADLAGHLTDLAWDGLAAAWAPGPPRG
jgi:AcrR family transcriptional regulator